MVTALLAYVEAHPWWTLVYLLVICDAVHAAVTRAGRRA